MQPLLSIRGLSVKSGEGALLKDIAFDIRAGESFALLGESGSGKSLTAMSILRLLPENLRICAGEVRLAGTDLLRLPEFSMRRVRGSKIGIIFQEPMTSLNPVATVGRQISEVLKLHRRERGHQARRTAQALLDDVGIADPARVFESYPHELSGGMKQRAMIAMALAGRPDLLIADEPTTALDVTIQAQVLELLQSLQSRLGMAMLFISHDLAVVSNVAERIAVMRDGKILEEASATGFFKSARSDYSRRLCEMQPGLAHRGRSLVDGREIAAPQSGRGDPRLVEVEDLKVYFPVRQGLFKRTVDYVKAVDGVSFELKRGRTLALVGESGSGKTTIAKALLNLVEPIAGNIRFAGAGRGDAPQARRAQIVFQDPFSSLNPRMSIEQIVGEGLAAHGCPERELRGRVAELLLRVGLAPDCMRRYPHQFSGGQRQRICIARALAVEPDFIIWDEPTSALDVMVQAQILELFLRLQSELGLCYLFITHDISVVAYMAHEVMVIYHGRIVEQGETTALLSAPRHPYTRDLLAAVPALPA